jgi:hypothetical protein
MLTQLKKRSQTEIVTAQDLAQNGYLIMDSPLHLLK